MSTAMPERRFARGFRLIYPDGFTLDGAQFPSGRCVVDDPATGLVDAAVDIEHLGLRRPGDRIEWHDIYGNPAGWTSEEIRRNEEFNASLRCEDDGGEDPP